MAMELHERLSGSAAGDVAPVGPDPFAELKNRIHLSLIEDMGRQIFTRKGKPITCVNVVGWSRGGVTCHMFANALAETEGWSKIPVNIFACDPVPGAEGCLSFPEIFADITRPEFAEVKALNEMVQPIEFRCGGLLARAVQHEVDHLNGILFIDRMDKKTKEEVRPELEHLQAATKAELQQAQKK